MSAITKTTIPEMVLEDPDRVRVPRALAVAPAKLSDEQGCNVNAGCGSRF
jgi:hypothetical protein